MLGGAGLVSTAGDYWRFAQALLTGEFAGQRFLGRKTLELMRANHLPASLLPYSEAPTTFHGYGFGLGGAVLLDIAAAQTPGSVGCFGWSGAASTDFWVDPVEDLTALFIPQVMPQPFGPFNHEFRGWCTKR
jgi:CubicO group peptidase (beta-lactamase class C family)